MELSRNVELPCGVRGNGFGRTARIRMVLIANRSTSEYPMIPDVFEVCGMILGRSFHGRGRW